MYTVKETPDFQHQAKRVFHPEELISFINWIAVNPLSGDVVQGTGGCRKVRWALQGQGKSGGARVIYFNALDDGVIVLLAAYAKSEQADISRKLVKGAKNVSSR